MTGMKYPLAPPPVSSYRIFPTPVSASRPFDIDQQMRVFIAEKRSAGLPPQLPPTPSVHSRTPSLNTDKSLPTPPQKRKAVKLTKKSPKSKHRFVPPPAGSKRTGITAHLQTELRPVPDVTQWDSSSPSIMSTSAPPILVTSAASDKLQTKLWMSLANPELTPIPQPWTSPQNSPLLPPPRGNDTSPTIPSADLPAAPSSTAMVKRKPVRVSSSTGKRRAPKKNRSRTSDVLVSVLGIYPSNKPRGPPGRSTADILTGHIAKKILPQRVTIDSITQRPRTPPPPPTPEKSQAQIERARMPPPRPTLSQTPLGPVAELEGSVVSGAQLQDCASSGNVLPASTAVLVDIKPRKKETKLSNTKPKPSPPLPEMPDGKEIYARLPLPAVPTPSQSRSTSPLPTPISKSTESSPKIDIELGMSYTEGLVEWFENFRWGEGIPPSASELDTTEAPASARALRVAKFRNSNLFVAAPPESPRMPKSGSSMLSIGQRASILNPEGAVRNGELFYSPKPTAGHRNSFMLSNSGLLSPVYPVSPRLASYYGTRSSFASSVGDAFRFDSEVGEVLTAVDEGHEFDVDELYQLSPIEKVLDEQVGGEGGVSEQPIEEQKLYEEENSHPKFKESLQLDGDGPDIDEISVDGEYEDDENDSDTSNEFDSRLEQEIQMILNGTYGGGSSDDWRDGIYSADSSSPRLGDDWEGEIVVGLDIDMGVLGKAEGSNIGIGIDGVIDDERWSQRPRTRYIAGRNSMLDNDVIFCLRGIDSM